MCKSRELSEPFVVDLDRLEELIAYLKDINDRPLESIAWQRNGETMPVNLEELKDWRFIGLSNVCFATENMSNQVDE